MADNSTLLFISIFFILMLIAALYLCFTLALEHYRNKDYPTAIAAAVIGLFFLFSPVTAYIQTHQEMTMDSRGNNLVQLKEK
ncbi:hypothetical protein [Bacillus toyonensis]|uniref:hypothetical protein n=1 Tax=Bacillus toyonensis TaxID=155322 RepID=UPI002E1D7C12|nr:hypothetical protein [Bacillus toyonensis]